MAYALRRQAGGDDTERQGAKRQGARSEDARIGDASTEAAGRVDFDVIVVGSGFGGSVAALRLSEKGYRVAVLEAGPVSTPPTCPAPPGTYAASCGLPGWVATASSESISCATFWCWPAPV